MEYEQHFEQRHNCNTREHVPPYDQPSTDQDEDLDKRIILHNYTNKNNTNLGIMDHPNISTESLYDNAPFSIAGQIMNNIDGKLKPITGRTEVTKSMPIPIQRTNDSNRKNGHGGTDNYFDDSSDDDNYNNVQSPIMLGQEGKQQQYSTPLDYSVTSVSSSSSSNILFQDSSHRPVAKSLPSRTALLRAPYLTSRKPSQSGLLDDDDYDNTDNGQDFYFDRPVSSNARKILVLPPSQQYLDSNSMNNNNKASYLMTGSLLNHSSSAVPAYGSLRESHLDGRFISKSFFPSVNGRSKNHNNEFHDNSVPSSTLAASAPGQLSIGERMYQSRLRRQQQQESQSASHCLGQLLDGTNEDSEENTQRTTEQTSSGRIKTRSLLGEMCFEGDNPNFVEVEEGTNVKVSTMSTPQIMNNSKSNEVEQPFISSDNISKFQGVPYIEQDDIDALTYSMNATNLDDDEVKGAVYNDDKTAEAAEEATLSKSLTAFDILRQLSGQQQRKHVNFQNVASSYIPPTTTNPRSNTIGMSSAMYGPLIPPSTSATTFSTSSSMQYQYNDSNLKQQYSNNVIENDVVYNQQYVQNHPTYEDNADTMGAFDLDM